HSYLHLFHGGGSDRALIYTIAGAPLSILLLTASSPVRAIRDGSLCDLQRAQNRQSPLGKDFSLNNQLGESLFRRHRFAVLQHALCVCLDDPASVLGAFSRRLPALSPRQQQQLMDVRHRNGTASHRTGKKRKLRRRASSFKNM